MKERNFRERLGRLFTKYNYYLILILLVIVSSIISDKFLTLRNILNLVRQNAGASVVAMGMLLVIMTGGIDLSVGAVVAVSSILVSYSYSALGLPMWLGLLIAVAGGTLIGCASGILVSRMNMAPFIVTLAMTTIAQGIAFIFSDGSAILVKNSPLSVVGTGTVLGIPYLFFVIAIAVALTHFVICKTAYGRLLIAIGNNETAVKLAGSNVENYKFSVYAIMGFCGAVAGIISVCRTDVGSPIIGDGMELNAIAAVVIGGTSLSGGKGSAFATLVGVFILALITNIMNLLSVPTYPQQIIKGLIIIVAVLLQRNKNGAKAA